jgi:hypothetical protein
MNKKNLIKKIIHLVNVEANPTLWYSQAPCLGFIYFWFEELNFINVWWFLMHSNLGFDLLV